MNDKVATPLSDMLDRIKSGVGKFGKNGADKGDADVIEAEPVPEGEASPAANHRQDGIRADARGDRDEDLSVTEGDVLADDFIEAEAVPVDAKKGSGLSRLKSMSTGKKVVLGAVVLAVAFAAKNQMDSGRDSVAPIEDPAAITDESGIPFASESAPAPESTSESGFDDIGLESESPQNGFDVNAPLSLATHEPAQAEAGGVAQTENATPPLSAGLDGKDPAPALDEIGSPFSEGEPATEATPFPPVPMVGETTPTQPVTTEQAPTENPFGSAAAEHKAEVSSFDPALSGTDSAKLDSGTQVLEANAPTADDAALKNQIAAKDKTIEDLQSKLSATEKQLEDAKRKAAAGNTAQPAKVAPKKPAPPVVRNHPQPKPVQRPSTKAASAAPARPQLCVVAVAQAARNCSTCVPHAFVSHKGQETMVGHGDYIEGYRVAIQGDRLDLQNSSGEVVHKYWSSPDGCRPN